MYVLLFKYYIFNIYIYIIKRNFYNNMNKNCICNLFVMVVERRRVFYELYLFLLVNVFLILV